MTILGPIKLEWEHVTPDAADAGFVGLMKSARSLYAIGMQRPPVGDKVAGSYFARVQVGVKVEAINRDSQTAATSVVAVGDDIALLGFVPSRTKPSAVFRLLDKDGRERWRHVSDSQVSSFPVSVLRSAKGFILVSTEYDDSPSSALILTLLSEHGAPETQRRFPIPLRSARSSPKRVALDSNGHLIVAIAGTLSEDRPSSPRCGQIREPDRRIPLRRFGATHLLSIDLRTLEVHTQKTIHEGRIAALRQLDGRLYAAFQFNVNCRAEQGAMLSEVGAGFELKTIFRTSNVNGIDVNDFAATKDGFVLVGMIRTFLPTASSREVLSLEQLERSNLWDELFWERDEAPGSAFVLVLGKDGAMLADRVFPDGAQPPSVECGRGRSGPLHCGRQRIRRSGLGHRIHFAPSRFRWPERFSILAEMAFATFWQGELARIDSPSPAQGGRRPKKAPRERCEFQPYQPGRTAHAGGSDGQARDFHGLDIRRRARRGSPFRFSSSGPSAGNDFDLSADARCGDCASRFGRGCAGRKPAAGGHVARWLCGT